MDALTKPATTKGLSGMTVETVTTDGSTVTGGSDGSTVTGGLEEEETSAAGGGGSLSLGSTATSKSSTEDIHKSTKQIGRSLDRFRLSELKHHHETNEKIGDVEKTLQAQKSDVAEFAARANEKQDHMIGALSELNVGLESLTSRSDQFRSETAENFTNLTSTVKDAAEESKLRDKEAEAADQARHEELMEKLHELQRLQEEERARSKDTNATAKKTLALTKSTDASVKDIEQREKERDEKKGSIRRRIFPGKK